MKKNLIWVGTGLLILALTIYLMDFVKEWIAIPILSVIRMIENLRQDVVWFLFIGLIIYFAYKNLLRWRISWTEKRYPGKYKREQIDYLTDLIRNSHTSDFFRERLVRYLSELTIEILAYRERLTPKEIREHLFSGSLFLPKDISEFLQAALEAQNKVPMNRKKRGRLTDRYSSLKLDPLRVVEYLESQLNLSVVAPEDAHDDKNA